MVNKKILGIAVAAALVLPLSALAAVNLTFLTVDGQTNTSVNVGDDVNAKVTFDTTSSTDVESLSWELVGSGLPQVCVNSADHITDGTFTSSFNIDTTGASEGTWDVEVHLYGDNGPDASNLCENTDQVDSQTFNDRITVTDDNNDNQANSGTGASNVPSWLAALIAALHPATPPAPPAPPTPPASTACSTLANKMIGTMYGVRNSSNVVLQGYLLSEGMSIPALAAGASFGLYLNQTQAALSSYKAIHGCQ